MNEYLIESGLAKTGVPKLRSARLRQTYRFLTKLNCVFLVSFSHAEHRSLDNLSDSYVHQKGASPPRAKMRNVDKPLHMKDMKELATT